MNSIKKIKITTTVNEDLYKKIQNLTLFISVAEKTKINANDLLDRGMELILEKYKDLTKDM